MTITVDDMTCELGLYVPEAESAARQLKFRFEFKAPQGSTDQVDTRAVFHVGWYDLLMIDNTRLANGVRCAITVSNFSPSLADPTTDCLPGEYASLKDRSYCDEVIQQLQEAREESSGAGGPPHRHLPLSA